MSSPRLPLVALALLAALLLFPAAEGETIIIDVNGNGDYTTIEDGLEAAEDGDLVRIWDGTYVEYNLTIEDQITVRGNGTSTVVNASWEGHGFIVERDYVEISHLKVESSANGSIPEGPWYAYFSGVFVNDNPAAHLYLESLTLEGNYVGLAVDGEFYIHVSNSTITNSTHRGAHFQGSWYLRIDNSTFSNNDNNGLTCYTCNHARIYYSVFENNGAQGFNSEYPFNQTFYETDFEENTGIGLYFHAGSSNSVRNAQFANNGGGITLTDSSTQNEIGACQAYNNEDHGYRFRSESTSNYLNNSGGWSNEYSLAFEDSSHNNTINGGFYSGDEESILFSGDPSTGIILYETNFGESLSINSGSELLIKKNLRVKVTDNGTSDSWKIYDNQSDENREAYSGTHAMWLGNPDKNDGEYEDNWDFSFVTKDEISLGSSPKLSIATWYETENTYDGGHVQISTDGGESWALLTPAGGYPCSNVVALENEGYCNQSNGWKIQNFSLSDYDNEDIQLRFRFASDASQDNYEGWYIDDVKVTNGAQTLFEDDFENGKAKWAIDRFVMPLSGADARVIDRNGLQYASTYFGGSDPLSNSLGWLNNQEGIKVITQRYFGDSTPVAQDVELRLRYFDWHVTSVLNFSQNYTKSFKVPDFRVYHSGNLYYHIQSAIENATAGDTVYVWNGTYHENVIIDRGVTLLGNGTVNTIIDGVGNTAIRVTGKYATIANLSVKGATNLSGTNRFGILVNESGGALNATGLRLYDNFHGIYFSTTKKWGSRVADSIIESNTNTGFGVNTATGLRIENCTINNNGNDGINLDTTSNVLIYGNHIHNNSGHGIRWNVGGTGNGVHHNRIIDNSGDGIRTAYVSAGSFTYNEIRNHNTGFGGGRGIYTGARNSEFLHNNITGNDYGITIFGSCCSGTYGTENQVSHNYISENSYGIHIQPWAGSNNHLLSNTISESDTGIYISSGSFHTIENSTISGSSSYDFYITTGEHTVVNSTFSSIWISTSADLRERELFSLRILEEDGDPFVDFEIAVEDGAGTAYASPHWGGSDDLTDSSGSIRQQLLLVQHWNGSATPDVFATKVKYAFGVRAKAQSQLLNQTTALDIHVPEYWRKGLVRNVDSDENYWSLETAISEASSGDALQIWPGFYPEMVNIEKPLVITGNSTTDVLLKGTGDDYVIDIDADSVTIRNLTVLDGRGLYLDKLSNDVTLEWLVIHNSSINGIYAFQNDNLAFSNLTVTNSSEQGIVFYKTTSSVVSDCAVSNSGGSGITVEDAYSVELHRITLTGNGGSGIRLDKSDSISVRDSWIFDNRRNPGWWEVWSTNTDGLVMDNVTISGMGLVLLVDNEQAHLSNLTLEITLDSGYGIYLEKSDSNTLRDILVSADGVLASGIVLEDSDDNLLINCTVSDAFYDAFHLRNSANDNTILDSVASGGYYARFAVWVASGTVVRNSTFSGAGSESGISLISAPGTTLDNVTSKDNGVATDHDGLSVSSSNGLLVKNSYFSNNAGRGAYIFNSDNVVIYSNQFDSNAHGLVLWTVDNARASYNSFEIGDGNAIELRYGSNSWIDNNTIEQYGNDASQNFGIGVYFSDWNRIHNNTVSDSEVTGILLGDDAEFNYVTENELTRIENSALHIIHDNNYLARNTLSETESTGITIEGDWNDIVDNVVTDGEASGIEVFGSNNQIAGNNISGNSDIPFRVPGHWNTFHGNTVDAADEDAVLVSGSNNQFTGNQLTNGDIGFLVTSDWNQFNTNILSFFNEACFDLSGDYITLQGNHCSAAAEGARLASVTGTLAWDNNWAGVETGLYLSGSAGNQFTNESVSAASQALILMVSSDNEFSGSSLAGEIHLTSNSTANYLNSSALQGTINCDSTSQLFIADDITIEARNADFDTPFESVHLRLTADGVTIYATPHFGGSDATTGSDGRIALQMQVHTSYDGSSSPETTEFALAYAFRLREAATEFNTTGPHQETVHIPDEWNYGLVQNLRTLNEYGLISDAVADAVEGDELLVWPSLYEESITVDKRLTITGLGPGVVVEGGPDTAFNMVATSSVLQGLTVGNSSTGIRVKADYILLANLTVSDISGNAVWVPDSGVSGLQLRDITIRNASFGLSGHTDSHGFDLRRVHISQSSEMAIELGGSDHTISESSFSNGVYINDGSQLELRNTAFGMLQLNNQTNGLLSNITADYLNIFGGGDNLLRQSTVGNHIELKDGSTGNRALDTTFSNVVCETGSTLAIEYRVVVELRTVEGPGNWLDVELREGGRRVYATPAFGGSDALSDSTGRLPEQLVAGLLYNGSATPESVLVAVSVQFNGLQESSFGLAGDSTQRVWLNLPPGALIDSVSPSPAIQGDMREPVDAATKVWWPLDEGSGTSSADGSGNGNNLTLQPTQSWAPGYDGSAVRFDGQFIYLEGPLLKLGTTTIELWFNTTDTGIGTLLSDYYSGDSSWNHHLYLVNGEPHFEQTQGGMPLTLAATAQFNDGGWHHVAVVRSADMVSLWVDGVMLDSRPSGAADTSQRDTWLGMSPDGSSAYEGLIDSVRISNGARHPADFLIGGGIVIFSGQASDPDGTVTNWTWISSQDGILGYGPELVVGVESLTQISHSITLQVIDSNGSAAQSGTSLVVMRRPGAVIIDPPALVHEGDVVTLAGEATGGTLITAWEWWSDVAGLLGSDPTITVSTLANGTHNVTLRMLASNNLWSEDATVAIYVNGRPRLSEPALTTQLLVRGGTVSFSATGIDDTDPGGQLAFEAAYRRLGTASWESAYLSDLGPGSFSFAPDFNASLGHYEFRLEAQDSHGGRSGWLLVPLQAEVTNIPPQVSTTLVPDAVVSADGAMLEFSAVFSDIDGSVQQLQWVSSLDGLLSTNATFSMSPGSFSAGNHTITLRVQDNDGTWSETSFTVEVQPIVAPDGEFFGITSDRNLLIVVAALLLGTLLVGGGLLLRSRETPVIAAATEEEEEQEPQRLVETWLPPEGLEGYEQLVAEYMARRREAYLAAPSNEQELDYLHNNRERFAISSYFEVPVDPAHLISDWALPENLRGNVHLDAVRSEIVERVLDGPPDRNYVIIGEPGVGKTVLLFELFDRLMNRIPVGRISTTTLGKAHEKFGVRLFYDDIQENAELVQALTDRQISGVILSAREADWASLPAEFQAQFDRLTVPLFPENEMKLLSRKMLGFSGLGYDEEAISALVKYAEGSPIYVWSMIREMLHRGLRALTASYIQENAIRGMNNYVSLLLQRLLKDGEEYRPGGLHALTSLVFLAETMEERFCHDLFYDAAVERLSTHAQEQLNDPMDQGTFNRALAYLPDDGNVIKFPHDTWVDVILGHGDLNPFRTELRAIFRLFVDSGLFEEVKREVVPGVWETTAKRYHRSPSRQKGSFLALADTLLHNFQVSELKELGVDIELIREVASTYSHLPAAASLVSRIQAAEPQQVTRIINIQDTVSPAGGGHPPYRIEDIYLIYNDGRLITGQSLKETIIDQDIMGSMLTAINDFVQDSFKAGGELGSIDYGDNRIMIERGEQVVLAVVIYGEETRELRSQVANGLRQVESRFSSELAGWNGDVDLLSGTHEILQPLLDGTREVSREMIDEYLALQKVGLRANWGHVAGHVRVQVEVCNYDSQQFSEAHLKLERTASLLELVATQPETEQTGSGVRLGEVDPHSSHKLVLWFEPRGAGSASLALRLDYRDSEGRNAGVTTTLFAGTEVFREDDLPDGKALKKLLKGGSQRLPASLPEPAEAAAAAPAETIEVTQAEQVPVAEAEIVVETEVVTEMEPELKPPAEAEDEPEPETKPEPEPVDFGESGMDDLLGKLAELGPEAPPESGGESPDDKYKKAGEDLDVVKPASKKKQQKPADDDDGELDDIFAKLKELDD